MLYKAANFFEAWDTDGQNSSRVNLVVGGFVAPVGCSPLYSVNPVLTTNFSHDFRPYSVVD